MIKDNKASFKCLKSAAERGNIYAIGNMSYYYYKLKLFNNAVDFAQRLISTFEFLTAPLGIICSTYL